MPRQWAAEESMRIHADAATIYELVADVRHMARWSPECLAVWARPGPARTGQTFVGWNRRRGLVWFTNCRVAVASPGREFAFTVTTFGLPVARWGYRLTQDGHGTTTVTEHWTDLRSGRGAWLSQTLGLIFTGTRPSSRYAVNRQGMRETLRRLRTDAEATRRTHP
ncbi:SRPBCC family protein [Streptomyces sp. NPDC051219]|uniref:SRPBCC family protein n=1 Tax=Streptomyces sp. NPDC051219 TaxID=3155283 RepID=UPI0034435774